jgi:hypothetical protein
VRFSIPVHTGPWGAHPASYIMGTRSFLGAERPGCSDDHPPQSSTEVKRHSGAIRLLPLWAFVACYRVNYVYREGKGKVVPLQAWSGPEGFRKLRFPYYMTTARRT